VPRPSLNVKLRGAAPFVGVALTLLVFHLVFAGGWFERSPAPLSSPHANDLQALVITQALAGRGDLGAFTGAPLGLDDCSSIPDPGARLAVLKGVVRNQRSTTDTSHSDIHDSPIDATPIAYLLGAIPALLLGVSPLTVRMGTFVLLGLLSLATYACVRAMTSPGPALAAGAAVTMLPAVIGGVQTLFPILGCTTGVVVALALLLHCDRFRRPGLALLAGLAFALAWRWGESFTDGIRTASVLVGPVAVMAWAGLTGARKDRLRAGLGLVLFATTALLVFDWGLAHSASDRMLNLAVGAGPQDALSRFHTGVLSYLWLFPAQLLGLPATILMLVGAAAALIWARPRAEVIALVVAVLIPTLLLGASDKRATYYLAVVAGPATVVMMLGLNAIPRVGRALPWLALAWLMPCAAGIWLADLSTDPHAPLMPGWYRLLAWDTVGNRPTGPSWVEFTHLVPIARYPQEELEPLRAPTATWLAGEQAEVLGTLPPGSLVAVQGWAVQSCDVAAFAVQSAYPDLRVTWLRRPQQPLGCAAPAAWVSVRWPGAESARPGWAHTWPKAAASEYAAIHLPPSTSD